MILQPIPKKDTRLQVRIPHKQKSQLKQISKQSHTTISDVIRAAIQDFIDNYPDLISLLLLAFLLFGFLYT